MRHLILFTYLEIFHFYFLSSLRYLIFFCSITFLYYLQSNHLLYLLLVQKNFNACLITIIMDEKINFFSISSYFSLQLNIVSEPLTNATLNCCATSSRQWPALSRLMCQLARTIFAGFSPLISFRTQVLLPLLLTTNSFTLQRSRIIIYLQYLLAMKLNREVCSIRSYNIDQELFVCNAHCMLTIRRTQPQPWLLLIKDHNFLKQFYMYDTYVNSLQYNRTI